MIGAGREQVREALRDLRQTVGRLREPIEVELPLPTALRRLAASFQDSTGLTIHLELPDALPDVTASQRLALYRAAQEGLTNVQRHAAARRVWLRLACSGDSIGLSVVDDGRGVAVDAPVGGYGLLGLRERASQLGGDVTITGRPEGGTILTIQIPLRVGQGGEPT
jgi:two-component system sensor histidine kinase UhpB